MPESLYVSSTDSDLTNGADFTKALATTTSTQITQNIPLNVGVPKTSYAYSTSAKAAGYRTDIVRSSPARFERVESENMMSSGGYTTNIPIAYGNGYYVTSDLRGSIRYATSLAGPWLNVNDFPLAPNGPMLNITFANGYFVATPNIFSLQDAWWAIDPTSTWTALASQRPWGTKRGIVYGGGVWASALNYTATSSGGYIYRSTNITDYPLTWVIPLVNDAGAGLTVTDLKYVNGVWIAHSAISTTATNKAIYTSTINLSTSWVSLDVGFTAESLVDIAYGNGYWVASGAAGTVRYATSLAGPWATAFTSTTQIHTLDFENGYFVGTNSTQVLYASNPTLTWTAASIGTITDPKNTRYVNGQWVVAGRSSSSSASNYVLRTNPSTPVGTWTDQPNAKYLAATSGSGLSSGSPSIATNTAGTTCVINCGENYVYNTSSDLSTWASGSITDGWRGIAFGNGTWLGVGNTAYTSTNPANGFTAIAQPGGGTNYSVAYGKGYWVVSGIGSNIFYSTSTSAWSTATKTALGTSEIYSITAGPNAWMCVNSAGTLGVSDGTTPATWRVTAASPAFTVEEVSYSGGYFIASGRETISNIIYPRAAYATHPDGPWTAFTPPTSTLVSGGRNYPPKFDGTNWVWAYGTATKVGSIFYSTSTAGPWTLASGTTTQPYGVAAMSSGFVYAGINGSVFVSTAGATVKVNSTAIQASPAVDVQLARVSSAGVPKAIAPATRATLSAGGTTVNNVSTRGLGSFTSGDRLRVSYTLSQPTRPTTSSSSTNYYLTTTDSSLAPGTLFNKTLETTTGPAGTSTFTILSTDTVTAVRGYGFAFDISNNIFSTGSNYTATWTVSLNIITGSTAVSVRPTLAHIDASGNVLDGEFAPAYVAASAGVKTWTVSNVSLGEFYPSDAFRLGFSFLNTGGMSNISLTIGLGSASTYVAVPGPGTSSTTLGFNTAATEVLMPWTYDPLPTGSGTAVSTGSASAVIVHRPTASGAASTTGSAALTQIGRVPITASGAAATSGSASASLVTAAGTTLTASSSGTSSSTGSSTATRITPLAASGSVASTGSALAGFQTPLVASGASTSVGSSAVVLYLAVRASGASVSTGSSAPAMSLGATASGQSASSGASSLVLEMSTVDFVGWGIGI